jgi:hypothetical protein
MAQRSILKIVQSKTGIRNLQIWNAESMEKESTIVPDRPLSHRGHINKKEKLLPGKPHTEDHKNECKNNGQNQRIYSPKNTT